MSSRTVEAGKGPLLTIQLSFSVGFSSAFYVFFYGRTSITPSSLSLSFRGPLPKKKRTRNNCRRRCNPLTLASFTTVENSTGFFPSIADSSTSGKEGKTTSRQAHTPYIFFPPPLFFRERVCFANFLSQREAAFMGGVNSEMDSRPPRSVDRR